MARPPKTIDWDLVERSMQAGCSAEEIYGDLGISINTFYYNFKEYYGCSFCEYRGKIHSIGKGNIRRTQYEKALEGNTQMLLLLGEEWLGQRKEKNSPSSQPIPLIASVDGIAIGAIVQTEALPNPPDKGSE